MAGQQRQQRETGDRRQASSSALRTTLTLSRSHNRAEPKRRSLKIWVGMQRSSSGRAWLVEGGWRAARKPTLLRRLPPIRVGCYVEITDVCTRVPYVRAIRLVLEATSRGVRRASHEHASHGRAESVRVSVCEGVRGWSNERCGCGCGGRGCVQQHAGGTAVVRCLRSRAHDPSSCAAAEAPTNSRPVSAGRGPVMSGYSSNPRVRWHGVWYHSRFYDSTHHTTATSKPM